MRGVVINAAGVIVRTVTAPAVMLAQQLQDGETLFAITDDTGAFINDAVVWVSETGVLEPTPSAPEGTTAPDLPIEFVT